MNHRSGCTMAQRKSRQKLEKGCSPGNKNNNDNGNADDKNENNHKNSRKKKKKKKKQKKNNKTTLTTKNSPFPSFGHQPNSAIVPASGWVGQAHPDCGSAYHRHHFGGRTPKHLGDSRRKLGSQAPFPHLSRESFGRDVFSKFPVKKKSNISSKRWYWNHSHGKIMWSMESKTCRDFRKVSQVGFGAYQV